MFESMKKFVSAFRVPSRADLERAYLDSAFDRVDLENRQRQIDRGLFRERYI
jgi:hypothetical protein